MGEETINYTIPAKGRMPEVTVSLDVTYGGKEYTNGSYEVTNVSGTYTTTSAKDGTTTVAITGLKHAHRRGNNDNRVFPNPTTKFPDSDHVVDQHGITFLIADPKHGDQAHVAEVNFFYSFQDKAYRQYGHKVSGKATNVTFSDPPTSGVATVSDDAAAAMACFASGTRIRTTRGDVAVEHLAVGDLVLTRSGAHRPIRWLGHRTLDCRRHPCPVDALPVRIAAHAFGESRPARDLVVSPGHAICVDVVGETLMPASALIDGTTIAQLDVARVTYWHVELDSHDIVLAENLPTESYLEMGNRGFFAESGLVALVASPDSPVRTHADFCRPFFDAGPIVEAVCARLAARAEVLLKERELEAA